MLDRCRDCDCDCDCGRDTLAGSRERGSVNVLMRELEKLLTGIASRTIGAARGAKRMAIGRAARREQAIDAILIRLSFLASCVKRRIGDKEK